MMNILYVNHTDLYIKYDRMDALKKRANYSKMSMINIDRRLSMHFVQLIT